jgi:hypothetical protein
VKTHLKYLLVITTLNIVLGCENPKEPTIFPKDTHTKDGLKTTSWQREPGTATDAPLKVIAKRELLRRLAQDGIYGASYKLVEKRDHGEPRFVTFAQYFKGYPVFEREINIIIARDGSLVGTTGYFVATEDSYTWQLSQKEVMDGLFRELPHDQTLARKVIFPQEGGSRPAYYVELTQEVQSVQKGEGQIIDGITGLILAKWPLHIEEAQAASTM